MPGVGKKKKAKVAKPKSRVSVVRTVMPDRVRITYKFTKRPAEYESVSAEVSLESSIRTDESAEDAIERVADLVNAEASELLEQYEEEHGD
jgi:hypothetical protein